MSLVKQFSTVGRGEHKRYVSCDEAAHECLCVTIFPSCSYKQFYKNKKRDKRDYRERCRGCMDFLVVMGTILIFPFWLILKVPLLFFACVFDSCKCSSSSICGWIIAICMFLLGVIADIIWVPLALLLFLGWFCLMLGKCCGLCCRSCDKKSDRHHLEDLERGTVIVAVNGAAPDV